MPQHEGVRHAGDPSLRPSPHAPDGAMTTTSTQATSALRTPATGPARARAAGRRRSRSGRAGFAFTVPFLAGFAFVFVIPFGYALYQSVFATQKSGTGFGGASTRVL